MQWFSVRDLSPVKILAWIKKDANFVLVWALLLEHIAYPTSGQIAMSISSSTYVVCGWGAFLNHLKCPFFLLFSLWLLSVNIWFLTALSVEWASRGLSAGSLSQHRVRNQDIPLHHLRGRSGGADLYLVAIRLLGAVDTVEPMYLILKWERAARSSLHTAFPSWSGITVGSKESMFSY